MIHTTANRCLNVAGGEIAPGGAVILWDCVDGETANERWTLPAVGQAGEVKVYGYLCLAAAGTEAGARLTTAWCEGQATQRWTLT
ncbi:ricin-type beta-trefoil lectin domain protein, partial [Roseisolibacter agri]|uniref:ricin-type beta-trefoil lectin domain protein n=1 Tax=Roseisolibacter agri TaxID=2014610 RepID=UPI0024E0DB58